MENKNKEEMTYEEFVEIFGFEIAETLDILYTKIEQEKITKNN